jgi:hypothetical protein
MFTQLFLLLLLLLLLVVVVPEARVRFPALPDFLEKKKKKETVVGLERGPPSLVSTTEELLDRNVAAPV